MTTRTNRERQKRTTCQCARQCSQRRCASAYVVDLTTDSPVNQLAPTQFEESLPQGQVREQGTNASAIVLDDVIDLSTPVKQKRLKKSPRKSCKKKTEKMSSECVICPVCLEELKFFNPTPETQVMSTQCGHVYCRACIEPILKQSEVCPKCRKRQTVQDIHPLYT